ncbi:MAG: hypothetical protein H6985_00635 [Pseudomonadales bacterium]|nr:hypothetical protein [Pseudomonadales bacterium]
MNQEDLFNLYEKLYFHELETREKILNRLQIPLAILVSFVSFYGYMAKGIELSGAGGSWNVVIYILLLISLILFALSLYNFIRAFFNHTYELIPTAVETEDYRNQLIEHYTGYPTSGQLVEDAFDNYLYEYYAECATANTKINDKRSSFIHNCNKWLVSNLPFLFLVFLIFSFCGVDKNLKEKEYAVKILNPIELESINSPIETRSTIENGEFNVDLSDSVKELLNDRRTEEEKQQSAPAPAAASAEKIAPGR